MVENTSRRLLAGRYEIRTLIGRGGMAEVHLGYDMRLSRVVAIKMLRLDLAKDSIFQKRFRREAQSAASLNHPAIVSVYDTGEERVLAADGTTIMVPYIVMEYVEGHTVRDLLSDGSPVPIDEAVEIVSGVLLALEYSHAQGLVHRDIKPGNVMLTTTGKVKVMDFGIARAMEDSQATMTQTDAVVGTAQYLSPEQARGELVDARSDLYSTGCLLFELLTGRPPFKGDSAVAVAYQHVSELAPTPSSITPDIPDSLDRVVMKSLAKRREDRYSDAAHMLSDLQAAARGAVVTAPLVNAWQAGPAGTATTLVPAMAQTSVASMPPPPMSRRSDMTTELEADKPRSRKVLYMWLVILLILIAGAGAAAYAVLSQNSKPVTKEVLVPANVIGMTQSEAQAELTKLKLIMVIGEPVTSDTVAADRVAAIDPPAGEKVAEGTKITVRLSLGKAQVVVPNVSRFTQEQAKALLEQAGLQLGSVSTKDDGRFDKDTVIGTDPEAGKKVEKGSTVNLIIATGSVNVPESLVGKTIGEVSKFLTDNKLSMRMTEVETNDAAPGTVLTISPSGTVPSGSAINVEVAKAKVTPKPTSPTPPSPPTPSGGH